ncbi:hypothetical protein [Janibacter sp. G1551]|uniref:hypothetical protein n=1 Tax=Janibacter sp. G1551 TaxID=3420440 RepID=UPI003D06F523
MAQTTFSRAPFVRGAALAVTAGAILGMNAMPAAADTPTDDHVAGFLATQLTAGGDHLSTTYGTDVYADHGLTVDAALALTATGVAGDQSTAATAWVVANSADYVGAGTDVYAGSAGKLLTLLTARGVDASNVGGRDLVAAVQSTEGADGHYADVSPWGDYSNAIGQGFALIGLQRAGANPSTAAVDFLLQQQCADGGFRLELTGDACVSDPDVTSIAVQALAVVGGHGDAISEAAAYLKGKQAADGSVNGGTSTDTPNSNSTGLAAAAFRIAGLDAEATAARAWVAGLVYDCSFPAAVRGGIAYDQAAFDARLASGDDAVADQDVRATTQAVLGLTDTDYTTATAAGESATAPVLECATEPEPTDDPSDDPTGSTDEPTGSTETPTDDTTGPIENTPLIPTVVQTDGIARTSPLPAVGAGVLAVLAAGGALLLGVRRRGAHR